MGNVQVATATERYLFFQGSVSQIKGKRIFGSTWGRTLVSGCPNMGHRKTLCCRSFRNAFSYLNNSWLR